jgi:shikimate kinase
MGCGKTTFGKWLSDRQQMNFIDTDEMIEKIEGRSINEIFAANGEEYFRDLETQMLKLLLGTPKSEYRLNKSTVISVGGGLPVREENRELLHKLGRVIFLDTSVDELVRRLSGDNTRPLLKGEDLRAKIENLMEKRLDIYDDTADYIVSTDNKNLNEIYMDIIKEYNQ